MRFIRSLKSNTINFIIKYPWASILPMLILTVALIPNIFKMQSDYSSRIWFRTSDPLIKDLDFIEEKFGSDERIILGIEFPDTIFKKENIELLRELTEKAWKLPEIVRVDSIINYPAITSQLDDIQIGPFFPENAALTEDYLNTKKEQANKDEMIRNQFLNKDGKIAIIFGNLRPDFKTNPDYRALTDAMKSLILEYKGKTNAHFYLTGAGAVNDAYRETSEKEIKTVAPLIAVVIILFLAFFFRSVDGVLMPMAVILFTILSTFGLAVLLDIKFDNLTAVVPSILIAICIADTMHIIETYYQALDKGETKLEALKTTLEENLVSTFITNFTTVLGFCSLLTTDIVPIRNLGILASFGSSYAWFFSLFVVAPLLPYTTKRFGKKGIHEQIPQLGLVAKYSPQLLRWIDRHKKSILISVTAFTILTVCISFFNEINSDPFEQFANRTQVKKDMVYLRGKFKGLTGPELVIDTGITDGIKDPAFLTKVESLITWLESQEDVNKVLSLTDIIKRMNQAFHGDDPNFFKIPESREQVAEMVLMYTMGLPMGMDINNRMSLDSRYLRLSLFWNIYDSKTSLKKLDLIMEKAKSLGLSLKITGKLTLYHRMSNYIASTFVSSNALSLLVIALVMLIILRSWSLGFISMLPNIIPLCYGTCLLAILRIPIDLGTAMVTSVCLGIVIDDTTHFLVHYREKIRAGYEVFEAIESIYKETGPALIYTTVILSVGFGLFSIADFIPMRNFGVLSALILGIGFFVDLFFLPAFLLQFKIKA